MVVTEQLDWAIGQAATIIGTAIPIRVIVKAEIGTCAPELNCGSKNGKCFVPKEIVIFGEIDEVRGGVTTRDV